MRPLTEADLPRAAALSALIGWNQTAEDWAVFLRAGAVHCLDDGDPATLAATAATLTYSPALAWISMVLVRPDQRCQGHATALMRWATGSLGVASQVLDATPAGREVYARLGFRDLWGFARWALPAPLPATPGPRPLQPRDWPALEALDRNAFGAPRGALLRGFAARLPAAAWVLEGSDGLRGAILGRDGLRAPQLGPLWARDAETARALLAAARNALPGPAVLDLRDGAFGLAPWLSEHGASAQRPFTRMALGAAPPGDVTFYGAVAGPEFG
jgi:GNAT superfamily N-acetyltransferase